MTNSPADMHLVDVLQTLPQQHSYVIAQLGQSLDGRIATPAGESFGINGHAALTHLHALRAQVDVIVVGAGTISADNPRLNVRHVRGRNPARAVIDPQGRISSGAWLDNDGAPCMVFTTLTQSSTRAEVITLPPQNGMISARAICAALRERGYHKILIEGGARTISHFLDEDCVDRLHILCAPLIIGAGLSGLNLQSTTLLARALRPRVRVYPFGDGDILFDCDFRCEANHDHAS
jgi:diaminohydroxyphosphoribosylaminopyrimidine deaminase / 5-amino-6-(5-phosphoribosylamino)uracil reductase